MPNWHRQNVDILQAHAKEHDWTVEKDSYEKLALRFEDRTVTVHWTSKGTVSHVDLGLDGGVWGGRYEAQKRMDCALALLGNRGRRYYLAYLDTDHWLIQDHMEPSERQSRIGPDARQRGEEDIRELNQELGTQSREKASNHGQALNIPYLAGIAASDPEVSFEYRRCSTCGERSDWERVGSDRPTTTGWQADHAERTAHTEFYVWTTKRRLATSDIVKQMEQ